MKTILVVILFPVMGFCQGFLPRWEMSLSTDANSYTNTDGSGSNQYISIGFRPGFYIVEGLSVEPELFWGATKGNPSSFNLSGNISYSYGMGHSAFVPFVLVGGGGGDGIPFNFPLQRTVGRISTISLINAGGGLKVMALGGRALLRIEYRYQRFNVPYSGYSNKIDANHILLGFGVLL